MQLGLFAEGALQPLQIGLLPVAGGADSPLVKIDHPHLALLVEQQVVAVEIGVIDPGLVQPAHRLTHPVPHLVGEGPLLEQGHQILGATDALDQDVGAIEGSLLDHAGREWPWHRQPLLAQLGQQTVFGHGAARFDPFEPEAIPYQLAHHAAAIIVAQHQVARLILHEPGHPATYGGAHHLPMGLPPGRIEQRGGRVAEGAFGIPADLVVGGLCQHHEYSGR